MIYYVEFVNITPVGSTSLLDRSREHLWQTVVSCWGHCIISAPASQAHMYIERVFLVRGMLTTGRRNRMTKSLETRACLKLNLNVLATAGFYVSVNNIIW